MMTKLLALTFSLLLSQPPALLAQDSTAQQEGWGSAAQSLTTGSKLRIETKSGERLEGKLGSVTDSALSLSSKGRTTRYNRAEIRRIYLLGGGGSSRAKSTLIGAGVGAGAGGGIAAGALGATGGSDQTGAVIALGVLLGAGAGAALGALAGKSRKPTLIYESK